MECLDLFRWTKLKKLIRWDSNDRADYHVRHLPINYNRHDRMQAIINIVDDHPFKWKIYWVAASGFLSSSYSLFASNVISPSIFFVYPPCEKIGPNPGELIDLSTLAGTTCGMLIMGHAADRWGRKRLYGLELVLLIVSTLGVAQASDGYNASMVIYGWIIFWRFVLGFGIGAEYPLSAIISAEWASTDSRGVMLAAVFLMQAVGRLLAYAVGIFALVGISRNQGLAPSDSPNSHARMVVDMVWRTVIGVGVFPAAVALALRLTIPETPRYDTEIKDDLKQAIKSVRDVYRRTVPITETTSANADPNTQVNQTGTGLSNRSAEEWFSSARTYLFQREGIYRLVGISVIWMLLDICVYGLSLDSPSLLATIWLDEPQPEWGSTSVCNDTVSWMPDPDDHETIYQTLLTNSVRGLELSSIASLAGSIVILFYINRIERKNLLRGSCLALAIVFAVAGGSLFGTYGTKYHYVTMVFYALAQFILNFGPNTVTFVMAVEIFPTVFRGTFYGIAAAMGKVGAIIIQAIIQKYGYRRNTLAGVLFAFSVAMLVSSLVAKKMLPKVQGSRDDKAPPLIRRVFPTERRNVALEHIPGNSFAGSDAETSNENREAVPLNVGNQSTSTGQGGRSQEEPQIIVTRSEEPSGSHS